MPFHCTVSAANIELEVTLERDETVSAVDFNGCHFDTDDLFLGMPGRPGQYKPLMDYLQEQAIEQLNDAGGFAALDEAAEGDQRADDAREAI